ncbi:hypothetical protein MVEN_00963600 [Mycena venus]|uniref:Uncharacterized protein n=1 Tax=Mycena venus TaxID=2733690 RepID=A0A8H6Y8J3_9AGAR|nr:hypothetical protein MVEN_00963600 [Mycena venus]
MYSQPANEAMATMPTYCRTLSPNELAYGLNDMFNRMVIHAPPALISPLRVRIVWAIVRLRHSLMACRVEMQPGRYDDAQFAYIPPSSPGQALAEATACVRIFDDVTGPELMHTYLNGPRTLSSECLSRLDVARHGQVSPGVHEFHIAFMFHHMINDSLAVYQTQNLVCELLGGSSSPGGAPRTDAELAKILDHEWMQRWGAQRLPQDDAIVPATEVRILGLPPSKFHDAAWKVDNQKIQQRFIGGHVFPRVKSTVFNIRLVRAKFDVSQTRAFFAKCKAERVTVASAVFGLFNFAWIRLCAAHPEISAPKDLPILMYTAISLRRYLKPASLLTSYLSLALDYHNIVLPAFLPSDADPSKVFWARSREAQRQMFKHARSPMLLKRAVVSGKTRGERAKAWARIDDAADGTLPPIPRAPPAQSIPGPKPAPSLALLGVTSVGDLSPVFRTEAYPPIKLIDVIGASRKAPGGMLFATRTLFGRFDMSVMWDTEGFPPGLMEEFWRYIVDGVHEYVIGDESLKGTAEEEDCLRWSPPRAKGKL